MNHAEIMSLAPTQLVLQAPYGTLHIPGVNFVDHVDMRIAALAQVLRLMAADDPANFMTSLCKRLSGDLCNPWADIPAALVLVRQLAEILLQEQTTSAATDLLWLCQQMADELREILNAMVQNANQGGVQ